MFSTKKMNTNSTLNRLRFLSDNKKATPGLDKTNFKDRNVVLLTYPYIARKAKL